jgi:DNA-binding transcriptional MerR regulator/methylmalonyl-CoA mutase cobalamin-binding subunit
VYTIKEASSRSGIGAPLIRAWERRYGVVRPARTASGYRLYDDATINVLLTMRSLIESGWTASEAARAISVGEVAVEDHAAAPPSPRITPSPQVAKPSAAATHRAQLIARFSAAAESTSPAETEAALDAIFAAGSFEAIVDDLLLPAAAALGDAWAAGRLSVAAEHAASAAVARRLAAVFQAAGVPTRPSVVVGLPPGARHELGAMAFAAALRRRRVGVLYLGPDVTIEGWVDAFVRSRARAAVIGVVVPADHEAATAVVAALQAQAVPIIAVGGAAAGPELAPTSGLLVLPRHVVEAAEVIAVAVGRRG